jgi:hypothetical protein
MKSAPTADLMISALRRLAWAISATSAGRQPAMCFWGATWRCHCVTCSSAKFPCSFPCTLPDPFLAGRVAPAGLNSRKITCRQALARTSRPTACPRPRQFPCKSPCSREYCRLRRVRCRLTPPPASPSPPVLRAFSCPRPAWRGLPGRWAFSVPAGRLHSRPYGPGFLSRPLPQYGSIRGCDLAPEKRSSWLMMKSDAGATR